MILDISLPQEQVEKIKEIITSHEGILDYHFLRTRQAAKINFVQGHLVFKDVNIKLIDAHAVSDKIESKIMMIDKEKEWIIDFHLDPYDDRNVDKESQSCQLSEMILEKDLQKTNNKI
jgi:divalent metal cation (Fe/Co/Zn/Cd) transporter